MLLAAAQLEQYLLQLAEQAESYGIVLELEPGGDIAIEIEPDGKRRFTLRGSLPSDQRGSSSIEVAERWHMAGREMFERSGYRYELVDRERDLRRAFHRHDDEAFEHTFGVVVHEHCEAPIGRFPCAHLFGPPVKNGYRGVALLMDSWVDDPPDCASLPCLEEI